MKRGILITLEGPEKSGKSTQARLLIDYLKEKGHRALFVREPGSTEIGEKIRALLLDKGHAEMSVEAEMLLYMAARAQLVKEIIRPALESGAVVLCDRFLDSTLAYQGYGCGMDSALIKKVGLFATGKIKPDLTILLDFWASPAHLKSQLSPDRIEMRSDAFHAKVKAGYCSLAKREPKRIKVVRVQDDINKTQGLIRKIVDQCLSRISSAKRARSRS
jgi:dTMP kinase